MADSWESLPDVKKPDDWEQLPDVVPAGKVASPTGWRDAADANKPWRHPEDWGQQADALQEKILGALVSALSGPSLFESQLYGAKEALAAQAKPYPSPAAMDDGMMSAYRKGRDSISAGVADARREHPIAPVVGAILGGPAPAETATSRLLGGYLQGGAKSLSESKADLTKGEFKAALDDTERGANFGLGAAAGGELLGGASRWLGKKAAAIRPAQRELAEKAASEAFASGRSALGGETSNLNRVIEVMDRIKDDSRIDQSLRDAARQFLDSPEGAAALNQMARSNLGRSGDAVARVAKSRDALGDLAKALEPDAVDAATDARMSDWGPVKDRLKRLLQRQAPTAIGAAIGGAPGAVAGSLVGSAAGAPGTTMAGILKAPVIAEPVLMSGAAVSGLPARSPGLLGEYAKYLHDEESGE
jgi:hypothetical protein